MRCFSLQKKHKEVQFHNYPYMIDKLRSKGLLIDSNTLAIEILKSRGYYNLINRYKEEFYITGKKKYREDVRITDLYYYHRIEDDLRNILFKFTINFEQRLKEAMAFTLAQNFGTKQHQYLDPYKFRNKSKAQSITKFLLNSIRECTDNPTKYYKNKYGNVPPWILLSNTTLGQTRMLFSIFPLKLTEYVVGELLPIHENFNPQEPQPRSFIANNIDFSTHKVNEEEFEKLIEQQTQNLIELTRNMLTIITNFRNTLAHGNRLIHFKANQKINLKTIRTFVPCSVFSDEEFYHRDLGKNDLLAFIVSLMTLMDKYDSLYLLEQLKAWKKANTQSEFSKKTFDEFIDSCGLPHNFVERLRNINIESTQRKRNRDFHKWYDSF